jgi:hypothetical protein
MAYTIIRSNGTVLTTIQDGTINTGSTSLGLPGRNYAGYGQTLDTNLVRMLENFANDSVPANPLRGQLWYNTNDGTLRICPADNTNTPSSWAILNTASSGGNTTLGNLTVSGNITCNNIATAYDATSDTITVRLATVTSTLSAANASVTSANLTTVRTQAITTGGTSTSGTLTGKWTISGDASTYGLLMNSSNITFSSATYGVRSDNYMYANGSPFTPTGTYTNANVAAYLTGNGVAQFTGNIAPTEVTTTALRGGGNIYGIWSLGANARIQSTYSADLAERYAADAIYPAGTVLEIGGEKEVTSVKDELSEDVFGVVSTNSAYLMNSGAGEDETHPQVALAGRVPVLVTGKITKGQRLVSAGNGRARGASKEELTPFNTIGRALASKDDDGEGVIEAVVIIK